MASEADGSGKSAKGKGRKWWKLAVWSPVVVVLCGLVGLQYSDSQTSQKIEAEEAKLLAMGVDVRLLPPTADAHEDYLRIARQVKNGFEGQIEKILASLEEAARKPCATGFTPLLGNDPFDPLGRHKQDENLNGVMLFCNTTADEAAKNHDWATLERLFAFETKLRVQLLQGLDESSGMVMYPVWTPPLARLRGGDAETRAWLRKKLEAFDLYVIVKASLAGIGRSARRLQPKPPMRIPAPFRTPPTPSEPWWKRVVQAQTPFRRRGELEVLRAVEKVSADTLKFDPLVAISREPAIDLSKELWKNKAWPAQWAANHMGFTVFVYEVRVSWNTTFIELDIRDSLEQGRPPTPTWSKKYCFDPQYKKPITVAVTDKGMVFECPGLWKTTSFLPLPVKH